VATFTPPLSWSASLAPHDPLPISTGRATVGRAGRYLPATRADAAACHADDPAAGATPDRRTGFRDAGASGIVAGSLFGSDCATRSEEHTSELQSRDKLVCPLLLGI